MSGTADVHLVVLLDNELRDLARAHQALNALPEDPSREAVQECAKNIFAIGNQALAHLIADPEAPFIVLGSSPRPKA